MAASAPAPEDRQEWTVTCIVADVSVAEDGEWFLIVQARTRAGSVEYTDVNPHRYSLSQWDRAARGDYTQFPLEVSGGTVTLPISTTWPTGGTPQPVAPGLHVKIPHAAFAGPLAAAIREIQARGLSMGVVDWSGV